MLKDKIQEASIRAMKEHNDVLKSCYTCLKAKIGIAEKSGKYDLPLKDEVVLDCVTKEIKELEQSKEFYKPETQQYIEIEQKVAELSNYLPKQLSEDEVIDIIKALTQIETNKGKLIGLTVKQVGNRFDKSKIAKLVNEVLG